METVKCDERGRIVLPKDTRERYGDEYIVIKIPGEIILKPVSKEDPLKLLQKEGKKLPKNLSVVELKKQAREQAIKDFLEGVKRK